MERFEADGFLNIFKPVGMTSHDVVAYVKRKLGARKVGHGGTLDPAACGVLVLLINGGTKYSDRIMQGTKRYRFEMTFGLRTDSVDAQGRVIEQRQAPITREAIEQALPIFTGDILQVPPMTSAIKVKGERLYKSAHRGETVERPPRQVTIHALQLVDFAPDPKRPRAVLDLTCGRGTYVRSLVEDLATQLGAVAMTSFLMRSAVGPFVAITSIPPQDVTVDSAARFLRTPDFLDRA